MSEEGPHRDRSSEIYLRRRDMFYAINIMGQSIADCAKELAVTYKKSEQTLLKDWTNRDAWVADILEYKGGKIALVEIMVKMRKAYQDAQKVLANAFNSKNINAQVGAVRIVKDVVMDTFKTLTVSGMIGSEKIEITTSPAMEKWMKENEDYFENETEAQEEIRKATEDELTNQTVD